MSKKINKNFNKQNLEFMMARVAVAEERLGVANERLDVVSTILLSLLATVDLPKLPAQSDKAIPFNEKYFMLDGKVYKKD